METQSKCDQHGMPIRYFCIEIECTNIRRLCAQCNRDHPSEHDIRQLQLKDSLASLSLNSNNLNKQQIALELQITSKNLVSMKQKIIQDFNAQLQLLKNAFKSSIQTPLKLLQGTKDLDQQTEKRKIISDNATESHQLTEIAKEIRDLKSNDFMDLQYIKQLCREISEKFTLMRLRTDQQLHQMQQIRTEIMELNPFSKKWEKIRQRIQKKDESISRIEEQSRETFLKSFNKSVIGWSIKFSVEKWQQCGKRLEEIQELSLESNNLEEVPQQLRLFPMLKKLNLGDNGIKDIKNLQSLTKLNVLVMYSNKITEITGLDELINLEKLWLAENRIHVITGLDKLTNLKELHLGSNQIKKIENLDHLTKLTWLNLKFNPLEKNQSFLESMKKMKEKGIKIIFLTQDI